MRDSITRKIFLPLSMAALILPSGFMVYAQDAAPAPTETTPKLVERSAESAPVPEAPRTPITIVEDTLLRVMTRDSIASNRAGHGTPVLFTVNEDVIVGDRLAIPRGATVRGVVTQSKKSGVLTGSSELTLQLTSLELGGRSYPLYTYQFKVKGLSKTRPTEKKAIRGAYVGAIVGSVSVAKGGTASSHAAAVGTNAAIGAGVGTIVSAVSPAPVVRIPAESQVDFYLASPIAVTPASAKEVARLAMGLHAGGPTLYLRNDTP